jgi:hypothetical protein
MRGRTNTSWVPSRKVASSEEAPGPRIFRGCLIAVPIGIVLWALILWPLFRFLQ